MNCYYAEEIKLAKEFLLTHRYDTVLNALMREAKNPKYLHSDRWAMLFNYVTEEYPGATGEIITGLAYIADGE
jgi:hypothetical protein